MKARCILLLFVIALLVLGSGFQLSAQGTKGKAVKAADPHVGTWKLTLQSPNLNPVLSPGQGINGHNHGSG